MVRFKPSIMVAANTEVAIAMTKATAAIPIVAANVTDPVAFGLVASHARPGGNVTEYYPPKTMDRSGCTARLAAH